MVVLAQQNHVERIHLDAFRFTQSKVIAFPIAHRERGNARHDMLAVQRQAFRRVIGNGVTALLRL